MRYQPDNALIVQSDLTILVETAAPSFEAARDALLGFAELVKSPEYIHTWRMTDLTLWNAAAAGSTAASILEILERFAKYPIPDALPALLTHKMRRYGRLRLLRNGDQLCIQADDPLDLIELTQIPAAADLLGSTQDPHLLRVPTQRRGELKALLTSLGHPIQDLAGYDDGDALQMSLSPTLPNGEPWAMRDYQTAAVDSFYGGPSAGSGVIVLPCGAGKTVVGIAAMVKLGMRTLILCTSHESLLQWHREILARTCLKPEDVGIYTAQEKNLASVTITTYQLLTWRPRKHAPPPHMQLFHRARWGLVIYDEVHQLPAPIFRESTSLQARRRLGLTATLVREDGHETDVFALIGPKRFEVPWKKLEAQGWIASARCIEVRVPLSPADRLRLLQAKPTDRHRIAAQNAAKGAALERLLARHPHDRILVLGTYVDSLRFFAHRFNIPLITGETDIQTRHERYDAFRSGEIRILALSKVGNFSVDLPDARIAIQVSGSWGSRQEEAQRLGRLLRPKKDHAQAVFYTLVSEDSPEVAHAAHRQIFLLEQGYPYLIEYAA